MSYYTVKLMNIKKLAVLVVALISIHLVSEAQLSVSITGNFEGCAPQILTFGCNVSGASGDVTYSWSAGNGDMSVRPDPTFSYINPGHYTLSVTVTSGGQTASDSHEIVVFRGPTALFDSTHVSGCVPFEFQSQSTSVPGDAAITSYTWYYGDGYSSTEASSTHTYQSSGVYTVALDVIDANGCVSTKSVFQKFSLSKKPDVTMAAHDAQWCVAPHEVSFTSEISTTGGLGGSYSVLWTFGDGSTSASENPHHTYNSTGNYDVSLTVTDSYGCSTELMEEEMVIIGMMAPECNVPEQVCVNQSTSFTSNADVESVWSFGDGTPTQPGPNTMHTYSNPGRYTVTFTVDPNGPCRQTKVFTVEVVRVEASFVTSPSTLFSCTYPFNVQFTSTSIGDNLSYYYSFGDSRISTDGNVTHTYTSNGEFTPTLTVTSQGGCSATYTGQTIVIREPEILLSASENGGCIPLLVQFTNTSSSDIVDYMWDYGDGTPVQHTDVPASEHYYYHEGTFVPTLTVRDASGCTASDSIVSILAGSPVLPEIFGVMDSLHTYIPRETVCASDTVILYNSMYPDHDTLDYVFVIMMNGNPYEESSSEEFHNYTFENDTGWAYVGLRVDYNQCKSDTLWWDSIHVVPPILKIRSISDCQSPMDYTYKITQNIDAQYWDWVVTNEVTGDTVQYVQHSVIDSINVTYADFGEYQCKIIGYNDNYNSCEFENKVQNTVVAPLLDWRISRDTICKGNRITINILDASAFSEIAYDWGNPVVQFDDLQWLPISPNMSDNHQYADSGAYDIKLYARQSDGCISEFTKHIYVVGAQARMVPESLAVGCVPATFDFEVIPETNDPLQYVVWDYGDGSPLDTTYNTNVPTPHTYNDVGLYRINMRITTQHGCKYSKIYTNRIKVVDVRSAEISLDATRICLGESSTFTAVETDNTVWHEWDFGDGTEEAGSSSVVSHTYAQPGHYTISHIVSEQGAGGLSCGDTVRMEGALTIESVTSAFQLDSTYFNCYPISPVIQNNSQYYPEDINIEYTWNMGNSEQELHLPEPQYLYTAPGIYEITLGVRTPAGCYDETSQSIEVTGPEANIYLSDTVVCAGGEISMSMIDASNVESLVWVVGGGYNYYTPEVTHQYEYVPESGYFPVTLSIRNGNCTIDLTEMIFVYRLRAEFSLSDNDGTRIEYGDGVCSPLVGELVPEHSSECVSQWFINGNQQNSVNVRWVNDSYLTDSLINVKVIVNDSLGCTDSISHQYYVYHKPELYVSNDTLICYGDTVRISAWGAYSYFWNNPIGDSLPNHEVVPEETTRYRVDAFTENMCTNSNSILVEVVNPYEISLSDEYFRINMGDTAVAIITYDNSAIDCYISPEESLTMSGCDTIVFFPEEDADYVLLIKDTTVCPDHKFDIHIDVEKIFTLDVPGAFTPLSEGDGNNIVYARGLGIKRLLQFRIFNRWGEEVFYTDDLHTGWDGTVNGKVQNSDTYSYYVEAEMFDGSIQSKKGNIMLIR